MDAQTADDPGGSSLRSRVELQSIRTQRHDADIALQPAAGRSRADRRCERLQRHLAPLRHRVRRLRQRQDGSEVQHRQVPGAGDERHHLHAEQPRESHRRLQHDRDQPQLDRYERQLHRRLRHPQSRGASGGRRRHVRRADRQLAQLRPAGYVDARESGASPRLGRPSVRLTVGRQPSAGAGPARVARSRLQPALVEQLHGHGQPRGQPVGLSGVGNQRTEGLAASGRRRLPDHDVHVDCRGGGAAGGQLRDVRNRLRSGAHQLLARR